MTWIDLVFERARPGCQLYCVVTPLGNSADDLGVRLPDIGAKSHLTRVKQSDDDSFDVIDTSILVSSLPASRLELSDASTFWQPHLKLASEGRHVNIVAHFVSELGALKLLQHVRSVFESPDVGFISPKSVPGCLRVIVSGSWNHFSLRRKWGNNSPVSAHKVLFVNGLSAARVREKLLQSGVPDQPCDVLSEVIVEETGGADWLCHELIEQLADTKRGIRLPVSDLLANLHDSHDVRDVITSRMQSLTESQRNILDRLLRRRLLKVAVNNDGSSFDLWVSGLARLRHITHANDQSVWLLPPAPVIERCLRTLPNSGLSHGDEPSLLLTAVNRCIFDSVMRVERFLREVVACVFASWHGSDWLNHLKEIKYEHPVKRRQMEEIGREPLESAEGDKVRVSLAEVISISIAKHGKRPDKLFRGWEALSMLTMNQLFAVIETKYNGLFDELFSKQDLQRWKQELLQVRNAVAHNQPIKFEVIRKIRDLEREIFDKTAEQIGASSSQGG